MSRTFPKILLFAIVFIGGWYALRQVDWKKTLRLDGVNATLDHNLGELFWKIIQETEKEIKDKEITAPIDSLLKQICSTNGIDKNSIKLHIIESDVMNAYTIPDGHIIINSSLILFCENEAQLAGVMAHEIAHKEKNHISKKLIKEVGLATLAGLGGNGSSEAAKEIARHLSSTAYDRSLETEADLAAADYLINASINPAGLSDFLHRLSAETPEIMSELSWLSTHPDSKERTLVILDHVRGKERAYSPILAEGSWEKLKGRIHELEEVL